MVSCPPGWPEDESARSRKREPGLGLGGIHVAGIDLRDFIAIPRAGVEQGKLSLIVSSAAKLVPLSFGLL